MDCSLVTLTESFITGVQTSSDPSYYGRQKDGTLVDMGDNRISQVVLTSSTLYFTRTVAAGNGSTAGVAYFAINPTTNAVKKYG